MDRYFYVCVRVSCRHVVGEVSLMAWDPVVAGRALELFQARVGALLQKFGGYLVEGGWREIVQPGLSGWAHALQLPHGQAPVLIAGANGFILASFARAPGAVRWALQCVNDLKRADW